MNPHISMGLVLFLFAATGILGSPLSGVPTTKLGRVAAWFPRETPVEADIARRGSASVFTWNDQQNIIYQILFPLAERASLQPLENDADAWNRTLFEWDSRLALQGVADASVQKVVFAGRLPYKQHCNHVCFAQHMNVQAQKTALNAYLQAFLISLGSDFAKGTYNDKTGQEIALLSIMRDNSKVNRGKLEAALGKASAEHARPVRIRDEDEVSTSGSPVFLESLLRDGTCVSHEYLCAMESEKQKDAATLYRALSEVLEKENFLRLTLLQSMNGTQNVHGDIWRGIDIKASLPEDWRAIADREIATFVEETQLLASTADELDPDTEGTYYTEYYNGAGRLQHPTLLPDSNRTASMAPGIKAQGYRQYWSTTHGLRLSRQPQPGMLQKTSSGQWAGFVTSKKEKRKRMLTSSSVDTPMFGAKIVQPTHSGFETVVRPADHRFSNQDIGNIAIRAPAIIPVPKPGHVRHHNVNERPGLTHPLDGGAPPGDGYGWRENRVSGSDGSAVQARRELGTDSIKSSVGTSVDSAGNPVTRALPVEGAAAAQSVKDPITLDTVTTPIKDSTKLQIHNVKPDTPLEPVVNPPPPPPEQPIVSPPTPPNQKPDEIPKDPPKPDGVPTKPENLPQNVPIEPPADPQVPKAPAAVEPPAADLIPLAQIDPAEVVAPVHPGPVVEGEALIPKPFVVEELQAAVRPVSRIIRAQDAAAVAIRAGIITAADSMAWLMEGYMAIAAIVEPWLGIVAMGVLLGQTIYDSVEYLKEEPHCPRPSFFSSVWDSSAKTMRTLQLPCETTESSSSSLAARTPTVTTIPAMSTAAAALPGQKREANDAAQIMTAADLNLDDAMRHHPTATSMPIWHPNLLIPGMPVTPASTCSSIKTSSPGYTAILVPGFACPVMMPKECTDEYGRFMAIKLKLRTNPDSVVKPRYCSTGDLTGHHRADKEGCVPNFDSQECIDRWLEVPKGTKAVDIGKGE